MTMAFWPRGERPFFNALRQVLASSTTAGRLNFSSISIAHCLRKEAGQITNNRRLRSDQYWHRTIPASIVLPNPTSSASKTPLDNGDFNANKAASIWCGFRSTLASNRDCDRRPTSLAPCRRVSSCAKYFAWKDVIIGTVLIKLKSSSFQHNTLLFLITINCPVVLFQRPGKL